MPPDASALESVDGFEIMPVPRPEAIREASVELGAATSTITRTLAAWTETVTSEAGTLASVATTEAMSAILELA